MDIIEAKKIVLMLAEGNDPITRKRLPENHICNNVEVVRALYTVLKTIPQIKEQEINATWEQEIDFHPLNAGKRWSEEDDELLCKMFDSDASQQEICIKLQRTVAGVAARLVRLGKIEEREDFRNRD